MNSKLCKKLRKQVYVDGDIDKFVEYEKTLGGAVVSTGNRHDYRMNKRAIKGLTR